jgi:hypothetical protein
MSDCQSMYSNELIRCYVDQSGGRCGAESYALYICLYIDGWVDVNKDVYIYIYIYIYIHALRHPSICVIEWLYRYREERPLMSNSRE